MLWLDIGNSRVKGWLTRELDGPVVRASNHAHDGRPADAIERLMNEWIAGQTSALASAVIPDDSMNPRLEQAWLADVTGPMHRAAIDDALLKLGFTPCRAVVTPGLGGLKPAYADPGRLGIDRFLMMLALCAEQPGAAFGVAAAGTALTFDAVAASGQHLGGVIGPGLWGAEQAVRASTRFSVAPQEPGLAYDDSLGRDTETCVRQGAFHACAGLLDRLGYRVPRRVLCGGDAATLHPYLRDAWETRPELVFEGLRAWARSLSSDNRIGTGSDGENRAS